MKLYYFLFLCAVCRVSSDEESEEDLARKKMFHQLSRTRTVLLDDYHLVTRQIVNNLYLYKNYRTVSIFFYPIGRDVTMARFTFQSEELHFNNIGSCSPEQVIINLKHGSYPAVNPDGYKFPKKFIDPTVREKTHTIEILSDGNVKEYYIQNPKPGNWYALVYVKWEDPKNYVVGQQGLMPDCRTTFYTDLQVRQDKNITLVDCYSGSTFSYVDFPLRMRCFSKNEAEPINFSLNITDTPETYSKLLLKVNALSLPTDDNFLISCTFDPKFNESQTIIFEPHPDAWHYIIIDYIDENATRNHANCESYYMRAEEVDGHDLSLLDLMRDERGKFFSFQYGIPTVDLQDATSLINLTSNEATSVRFEVNQFLDIGGSLAIEASLLMTLKYYMGYKREIKKGALLAFTKESQYFKVVICVTNGYPSTPLESGHCKYNDKTEKALFVLNSTDSDTIYDSVIIPFPESGTWYATLRLFCDHVVCPCPTSHNGKQYYVKDNRTTTDSYEDISGELTNDTWKGGSDCNATVVLSLTSDSCVGGRCSNHGTCLLNTMGGHVISYCSCRSGYGGWDCSDASRLDGLGVMLSSVLLLTLSNLLFIFSIYIAIIRHYYTEALMYTFTMLFSTFYHACDAPPEVYFCIFKANLLQFGDFYCGLMAFWVTLMAMAILAHRVRSSLQLFGAVIIAIMTTWNMHNLLTFLLPVAMGVLVLLVSWYIDYRKTKKMVYPGSYYRIYLPIGIVLVSVGLVCYAFLQTERNYRFVHSLWHMVVAVSVIFLLPDVKRTDVNPFLPSENYFRLSLRKIRARSQRGNTES